MAAYTALVSLMNNIEQTMSHPRLSTSLHANQIQSLQEKSRYVLDFIEGYSYGGLLSKKVEDLERRIASAAHTAEDMIESHIVDQILARSSDDGEAAFSFSLYQHKKMAEDVDQFQAGSNRASLSCSHYLQQIIGDMVAIMEKAAELKEKQREEKPQQHPRPPHVDSGETAAMVRFNDELIQLVGELTSQQSSRLIISIVGMGGMGKTTLARNVYENSLVKQHFDVRAWAVVFQQYNVEEILSQLLSGLGESSVKTDDT